MIDTGWVVVDEFDVVLWDDPLTDEPWTEEAAASYVRGARRLGLAQVHMMPTVDATR